MKRTACKCLNRLLPSGVLTSPTNIPPEQLANQFLHVAHHFGHAMPSTYARHLGIEIERRPLSGSLQAMLCPLLTGGFSILINSRITARTILSRGGTPVPFNRRAQALWIELLIGHELGHTFFYGGRRYSELPRYVGRGRITRGDHEEEDWCNEFSVRLIRPFVAAAEGRLLDRLITLSNSREPHDD